jgi:Icc-related predicted phosphoesterase
MRIHLLSDLHQEFAEIAVPEVDCDLLILAGDVSTKRNGIRWIKERGSKVPVIYICGNHEYYGDKLPALRDHIREEAAENPMIHFLENESVVIDGVPFFACTLWANLELQGPWQEAVDVVGPMMNDYKRITHSKDGEYRKLRPADTRRVHLESMVAMQQFFQEQDSRRSVVVTHHAPSPRSLPERRRPMPLSAAYASDLEEFILAHQPQLWLHGHVHHSNDYMIGATRVISNPRGYPGEQNPGFDPALIIEVPSDS